MKRKKSDDSHKYKSSKLFSNKALSQKEQILISHKSFLEIILQQTKNYQNHLLNKNQNLKKIKQYLIAIKANLTTTLKDKLNSLKYLEKEIVSKNLKIQQQIYGKIIKKDSKEKHLNNYKSINSMHYIPYNHINKTNNKEINFLNEKRQLENLSFQMENEINKIEFEIEKKINLIIKLKNMRYNQEEDLEIVAIQKNLKLIVNGIMKKKLKNTKNNLLKDIKEKIKKDKKINSIQEEIEKLKQQIKNLQENINTDEIIYEESSDFTKSIIIENNITNKDNLEIKDKKINNIYNFCYNTKNKDNRHSLGLLYKINDNFNINIDNNNKNDLNNINNQINSKVIRSLSNKINKFNLKNNKKYCKFNINFNFNVNNLNIINGQLNKDKDENYYNKSLNLTYSENEINKRIKKIL